MSTSMSPYCDKANAQVKPPMPPPLDICQWSTNGRWGIKGLPDGNTKPFWRVHDGREIAGDRKNKRWMSRAFCRIRYYLKFERDSCELRVTRLDRTDLEKERASWRESLTCVIRLTQDKNAEMTSHDLVAPGLKGSQPRKTSFCSPDAQCSPTSSTDQNSILATRLYRIICLGTARHAV